MKTSKNVSKYITAALGLAALTSTPDSYALSMRGTLFQDSATHAVGFNLTAGSDALRYRVTGNTVSVPRTLSIGRADSNYNAVRVVKEGYGNGQRLQQSYANWGMFYFHPRDRDIPNMMVAGIPVRGRIVSGAIDSGLDFSQLQVGGTRSHGELDYSALNGYHSPMGGLYFGSYAIRGRGDGGRFALNYDNLSGQNLLQTDFTIGNLHIVGTVQFSDRTSEHESCSTDSEGHETCTTTVSIDATRASVNWTVTRADGSELELAQPFQPDTEDDATLRALIAFVELTTADVLLSR